MSLFETVIIVAPSSKRRALLAECLAAAAQCRCLQARGAEEARTLAAQGADLAVIDVAGSWDEALRVCRALRDGSGDNELPLLAVLQPADAIRIDLRATLDDFVVEPYPPEELSARLRALAWRRDRLDQEGIIKIGDLVIDQQNYLVLLHGQPIDLTLKEYQLLCFFAANRRRALPRHEILDSVWGGDYYGGERTVDVHVRRLRAKLPQIADRLITVHGIGYRFLG